MRNNPPCPPGEETPYTLLIRQNWEFWYPIYLQDAAWIALRNQILGSAGWRCEFCSNHAEEVHHKTYVNVGNEAPEDLQAVCRRCHKRLHAVKFPTQ